MPQPDTMTAVQTDGFGGPEVLKTRRVAKPSPREGEVLIRVIAAGVNRPDIGQRQGNYPPPPGASEILGLECAGVVAAVGPGVKRFGIGARVCALVAGGAYAEYCVAPEPQVLPIPAGFSMVEAAGIPETFFTVWSNVFDRGRLKSGESLLIHGGSSGIGTTAIQLAKQFGALVFVTVGGSDKAAACLALGADHAIDYRAKDFVAAVKAATGGKGVDVVLDMIGGDYTPRNIEALAMDGRLIQIAWMHGANISADFSRLMQKRLTWTGAMLRPRGVAEKGEIARALEEKVWPLFEAGTIRPIIDRTFPLADAAGAHAYLEASGHVGKVILTVAPEE
jgi:NADPH2:quinone reductase